MHAVNCSSIRTASYEYVTTRCNTAFDIITDAFSKVWPIFLIHLLRAHSRSSFNEHSMEGTNQPTQEISIRWHLLSHIVHGMRSHHQNLGSLERSKSRSHLDHVLGANREFSRYDTLQHSETLTKRFRKAIVIACLASFPTLYAHTDRRPRHSPVIARAPQWDQSGQKILFKNRGHFTNTNEDSYTSHDLRPMTSSEDVVPLDAVHVRQDFSVASGPNALNYG